MEKRVLAFDFGASSGRATLGIYNGDTIKIEEIHRFSNDPVMVNDVMYWDILRLFHEIKQGIIKANNLGGFNSIGIDTWGVDFGLLDNKGNILENPIHYRDKRTMGMVEKSFEKIPKDEFYKITGNQFMEINTAFQLLSIVKDRPELIERVETILMIPDLFNYMLTGNKCTEYSIASTTQLVDANNKNWSDRVVNALNIPRNIFTEIVPSGTIVGKLSDSICSELGIDKVDVVAVAGHDTQSALLSVPTQEKDFVFLSCGTWSLIGTELDAPVINKKSEEYNITNEGGYEGKTTFLKNIIGLWLIQESRRQWIREGKEYSFGELEELASKAKSLKCFIDPDSPEFVAQGNIPKRIQEYCIKTNQVVPKSVPEIVRCINESLALKYRKALEEIEDCTGKYYDTIYMVGGGIQSKLLCQLTANVCGRRVIAGPVEATVLGNLVLQLIATGEVKGLQEARNLIAKSQEIKIYEPKDSEEWNKIYDEFLELIK